MKKLILVILFLPLLGSAQYEFYNKGGDLYIQKGAMLYIGGTLTNTIDSLNGHMQNDGVIELSGDFVNDSGATFRVFNDATSRDRAVKFIGAGTQSIQGKMSDTGFASFYNLVIDKAIATDSVQMQAPVTVEGSLVFGTANTTSTYNPTSLYTNNGNTGLLKTYNSQSEFLLDIQNGDTDAISGYPMLTIGGAPFTGFVLTRGLRSTVDGGLQRKVISTKGYVYPIGTVDHGFNGVSLNFDSIPGGGGNVKGKFCDSTSSSAGLVGKISPYCSYCPTTAPDNTGYNRYYASNECNGGAPQWLILDNVIKAHGFWSFASSNSGYRYEIETFPNTFNSTGNSSGAWRTLKYESSYGSDPSADTTDWGAAIESSVSDLNDLLTYTKNSGCYDGNGVPGGRYKDFSHFMMGQAGAGDALPVKLLYLKAEAINNEYIQVSWSTAIEINNAGFKVMRSTDAVSFTEIGWVSGHNNSTTTQTYFYNDTKATPEVVYYYKLLQVDNNGNSEQTDIVAAKLSAEGMFAISDFIPNPAGAFSKLIITTGTSIKIDVKVYDMLGREIQTQSSLLTTGENEVQFDVNLLPSASYTAVIKAGEKVYSKRLVVVKN